MKTLLIALSLVAAQFFSLGAFAGERILECMEPVHLDDPNFVQGSELFFDIFWDEAQGVEVVFTRGNLSKETLFKYGSASRRSLDLNGRSLVAQWTDKAEVLLGVRQISTRWYGSLWFSNGFKSELMDLKPGTEINLACIEKGSLKE